MGRRDSGLDRSEIVKTVLPVNDGAIEAFVEHAFDHGRVLHARPGSEGGRTGMEPLSEGCQGIGWQRHSGHYDLEKKRHPIGGASIMLNSGAVSSAFVCGMQIF